MNAWLVGALFVMMQAQPTTRPVETAHLAVTVTTGAVKASRLPLHVDITPKPGMHVYAPGQEGYLPLTLTIATAAPVTTAGSVKLPDGEKYLMPALNETQVVYSKPFRITQQVTIKDGTRAGPLTIKGTLRYQACDDKICYLPVTVPLTWTVDR